MCRMKKYGEVVCAWIIPSNQQASNDVNTSKEQIDEEEIREYCHDRISHFKIPKHIRFVDEFPMTVTGKPQKFIMREHMAKDLGLDEPE